MQGQLGRFVELAAGTEEPGGTHGHMENILNSKFQTVTQTERPWCHKPPIIGSIISVPLVNELHMKSFHADTRFHICIYIYIYDNRSYPSII